MTRNAIPPLRQARVDGVSPGATLVGRRVLALATVVALLLGFGVMASAPVSAAADVAPTLSIFVGNGSYAAPTPGPATSSALKAPAGLAFDSTGNLYVADQDSNVVLKVTPGGTLSVFAGIVGSEGSPTPGPATSSTLRQPVGLAFDAVDNLYISDPNNYVVERVTPDGTLSIFAGIVGFKGSPTPGSATSSALGAPYDLAFDSSGNLYIADSFNSKVVKVSPSGTLSVVAGSGSYAAPTPGPATSSALKNPAGLAFDSVGNLYFSDLENYVVMKVTPDGTLSIVAGSGVFGAPTEGPATSSDLTGVFDLAADPMDNLIIADAWSNLVLKVSSTGELSILAGSGVGGPPTEGPARLSALAAPSYLAFDSSGDLYIADYYNSVVEKVSIPDTAPSAPRSLVATPGNGSASIAFTPGFNGGSAITKYQVKVGSGAWTDAVGTTSPITVSGLTNFAVSRIKLRAVNSVGVGAASTAVAVTPRAAGPSIVSATPSGRTGIVVTFSLNPLPGTTVSYQSVTAYARDTNTAVGTCRTYAKRTTCYLGGLTRGTDYGLRATAYLPVLGQTWHQATLEGSTLQVRTNG